MNSVSIVGVGLIGGSFALALRKAGFAGRIIGVSSPQAIRAGIERGAIDEGLALAEAAAQSDLIYLARPISGILEVLRQIDAHVRPGTLITDAGSTKAAICERATACVQRGRFVGGHPMAGKETRGASEADADLFRGRPYVLTSRSPELEPWLEKMGARVVILDAAEHDRLVAMVSHLPQLISTALASALGEEPKSASVAGPAAMDLTRLALSPYDIWRDIFATNAGPIDAALSAFIARLEGIRAALRGSGLEDEFERAAVAAQDLRDPRGRAQLRSGRPLATDDDALRRTADLPAFFSKPPGAPVYHGFRILHDVAVDGFIYGAITDFEAEETRHGDAFVIAPDNSRAGLVWEVSDQLNFAEAGPMTRDRWGVWAVCFPFAMSSRENARKNLEAVLPELRSKWLRWRATTWPRDSETKDDHAKGSDQSSSD